MADKSHGRLDFLVLGRSPDVTTSWPHRVAISVYPRGETTLLNFSVGPHIVNTGGQVPVTQVILDDEVNETYAEELDACDARWFVPNERSRRRKRG